MTDTLPKSDAGVFMPIAGALEVDWR